MVANQISLPLQRLRQESPRQPARPLSVRPVVPEFHLPAYRLLAQRRARWEQALPWCLLIQFHPSRAQVRDPESGPARGRGRAQAQVQLARQQVRVLGLVQGSAKESSPVQGLAREQARTVGPPGLSPFPPGSPWLPACIDTGKYTSRLPCSHADDTRMCGRFQATSAVTSGHRVPLDQRATHRIDRWGKYWSCTARNPVHPGCWFQPGHPPRSFRHRKAPAMYHPPAAGNAPDLAMPKPVSGWA